MKKNKTPIIVAVFFAAWFLSMAAFIVLKCFGILSWSWWYLLVPAIGPLLLLLLAVSLVGMFISLISSTSDFDPL